MRVALTVCSGREELLILVPWTSAVSDYHAKPGNAVQEPFEYGSFVSRGSMGVLEQLLAFGQVEDRP